MKRRTNRQVLAFLGLLCACGVKDPEVPLGGDGGHAGHGDGGAAVTTSGQAVIDASDYQNWVYFHCAMGGVMPVSDPMTSRDWDMRVRRTQLGTNSGTSGGGSGGERSMATTDWNAVGSCPTDGYQSDAMLPIPGPPGSGEYSGSPALADLFDYDPATHAVSSKGLVYCVRTGDGKYAKFAVVNYASGQLTLRWSYQPNGSTAVP
jgi:hypothetical protein